MALFGLFGKKKSVSLPDDVVEVLKLWQKANAEEDWNMVYLTAERLVAEGYAFHWSLGECYLHGRGVKKDLQRALSHFELAMEKGSAMDMGRYADLLFDGVYLKQDKAKALYLYRSAAALEDAHSCLKLYRMQTAGILPGVQYSEDELAWMLLIAAMDDEADARSLFRRHCSENTYKKVLYEGLARTATEHNAAFLELCKKAASYGSVACLCNLGYYYSRGIADYTNELKAVQYWRGAAELYDYTTAMYNLAIHYKNKKPYDLTHEKDMLYWYTRAAEGGHAASANNLAGYYYRLEQNKPDSPNYKTTLHWLHRAAELGSSHAMYNLYRFYDVGLQVEQDSTVAMSYLRNSANLGNPEAISTLQMLYPEEIKS